MKRKDLPMTISSILAALLCGCTLLGCAGDAAGETVTTTPPQSEAVTTVPETVPETKPAPAAVVGSFPLTMSQTARVAEKMSKYHTLKFPKFVADAETYTLTPGLAENMVPQGLARHPETNYLYVSGYDGDGKQASVVMVLDDTGVLVAEYIIHKDGGSFTGHVGGVAVTEDVMYLALGSDAAGNYIIGEWDLADLAQSGSQVITVDKTVAVPMGASWLSYADGILWVGNFYLKGTYDLGNIFDFTTESADGKAYGGYAVGYDLSGQAKKVLTVGAGEPYAIPDYVLATPDKVQGFVYTGGDVALSISYGRNNNSSLAYYTIDLDKPDRTLTLDGRSYPLIVLDSRNHRKTITALPMTEGMCTADDGKLFVVFESGAIKYSNASFPTDHIWRVGFYR